MRRLAFCLLLASLPMAACSQGTPPTTSETPASSNSTTPSSTPEFALTIVGDEEVVYDWTTDKCASENAPDVPVRAFRDASGQVQLMISHFVNHRMTGPDLGTLSTDCSMPVMDSDYDGDPSRFNDREWIASPYTEDGRTVFALVHNEFWGHTHPGQCPQQDYFPCWDNSITLAISTDGGKTYDDSQAPPAHLVARLPVQYEAGAGPAGARNPSNIIKANDGYYYSFFNALEYHTQRQWVCLMRSDDLSDPGSWRFWNGNGFDGVFINPYTNSSPNAEEHTCPPLELANIGASLNDSITYNTFVGRYVLVGLSADHIGGREVWGIYYSFSHDLLHWTRRTLLAEMPLPWTVANAGSDVSILYPALLDPTSESRNFETTGRTAYLYFTRHNHGQGSLDRDLIRVPVEFVPAP